MQHLVMRLEAPLMSFGGETVDNYGVIRSFPAASMLAGLGANALGWRRTEPERHQRLQDRLVFAARIDREPAGGVRLTDFQTAAINNTEEGWTTRGQPEGRRGGNFTNHLRYRDYFADMRVTVALRLEPAAETPTLDELAAALQEPARPLFLGRKPCLPAGPLLAGFSDAPTALAALLAFPLAAAANAPDIRTLWPDGEGIDDEIEGLSPSRSYQLTDQRNWRSGLHGGGRPVHEGRIPALLFAAGPRAAQPAPEVGTE